MSRNVDLVDFHIQNSFPRVGGFDTSDTDPPCRVTIITMCPLSRPIFANQMGI